MGGAIGRDPGSLWAEISASVSIPDEMGPRAPCEQPLAHGSPAARPALVLRLLEGEESYWIALVQACVSTDSKPSKKMPLPQVSAMLSIWAYMSLAAPFAFA